MDLYIIHFIFISACVTGSWIAGFLYGEKNGSARVIEQFLDDKLITVKQLKDKYGS